MDPVILNTILAIWPVVLAGALFLAFTFGYIRVAPGPRRWHILLALSNVGVLAYAVLCIPYFTVAGNRIYTVVRAC